MHSCIFKKGKFLEAKNDKKAQLRENYVWEKEDRSQGVRKVENGVKDSCLKVVLPKDDVLGGKRKQGMKSALQGKPHKYNCLSQPWDAGKNTFLLRHL